MKKKEGWYPGWDEVDTTADKQQAFVFLSGNLALDLVNTEVIMRGKDVDLLVTPQDVARWWTMAHQVYPDIRHPDKQVWSEQDVLAIHAVRKTLRHIFEALIAHEQVQEHDIQALNAVLQKGSYMLDALPAGKLSAAYRLRRGVQGGAELSVAFAALSLLTEQDLNRLHICRNDACKLLFYDNTRSATRHWCSVACTNRARSRQHYRQAKELSQL